MIAMCASDPLVRMAGVDIVVAPDKAGNSRVLRLPATAFSKLPHLTDESATSTPKRPADTVTIFLFRITEDDPEKAFTKAQVNHSTKVEFRGRHDAYNPTLDAEANALDGESSLRLEEAIRTAATQGSAQLTSAVIELPSPKGGSVPVAHVLRAIDAARRAGCTNISIRH